MYGHRHDDCEQNLPEEVVDVGNAQLWDLTRTVCLLTPSTGAAFD